MSKTKKDTAAPGIDTTSTVPFSLDQLSTESKATLAMLQAEAETVERDAKEKEAQGTGKMLPILNDRRWFVGDAITRGQDFLIYFYLTEKGPIRSDYLGKECRLHNGLMCNSLMRLRQWGLVEETNGTWKVKE